MPERPFVHLHCHSHYSLLDGANRIPELVAHTKALGMNALALTDHGNLYGAIEFYQECTAAGIKPIIGYEAYVAPHKRTDREARRGDKQSDDSIYHHLTLLAKNAIGFRNLIKMASAAFLEGFHYKPRIDKELLAAHHEGIVCLSGCAAAEFSDYILKDQLDEARKVAEWFAKLFGDDFHVEIQNNGLDIQRICAEGALDIARQLGVPAVATSDAHYLKQEDSVSHDVLLCINTGRSRSNPNRFKFTGDQFHIRPPEDMYALFPGQEAAVKQSQVIADGIDIQLDFKKRHFPVFVPPQSKQPEDYLRELCEAGLRERYGDNPSQAARDRLAHELGIICRMGFASYFLIVWDFVDFARKNDIPSSARGSACGAVVSYVLKLSDVDPLEYDLLFERFLDPNRGEAPDIDIDFCQEGREKVIAYVRQRYGEASVAQIATFGTMAARAAIKDVGRALDIPLERVTRLTNMIPKALGITLEESLQQSPDLKKEYDSDIAVRELIDIAQRLEGTNRNVGTHAAGVVIANGPVTDYVPVQRITRKSDGNRDDAAITTQWVMGDLEKVGMLKMDFLGLRTLTLLNNAVKLIAKTRGETLDLLKLPLDDVETYKLLQRGDAKGVFQLESDGIRELLKRMKPDNIRDLIAIMALYRPGPLQGGMVDAYVNRKHGREQSTYPHPVMKEVLAETYGVMVYQEQIMRILNRLGGIELSSAYACIKAISKKKHDIIDQRRAEFLRGSKERGLDEKTAREIFDLITFFGGYGFNKCVVGDTVIIDAETGRRTTIKALFEERQTFTVHALGEDGLLRPRRVTDVVSNGRKSVYELRTSQGKSITATGNHPFWTLEGWKNLEELRPGDRVGAPRRLNVAGGNTWPRHEIIALAGLISEGNTCHPGSLYFFGNDPALVEDFAQAISSFPETVARTYPRDGRRLEVCADTGRDCRFRPRKRIAEVSLLERKPIRSGAFRWAEGLGITGRRATEKCIPAEVFGLRDADLELFLGRLWAGDGYIGSAGQMPFYATSSAQLACDVQLLLLRLGIVSGIHGKEFAYRDSRRTGYTVHLVGDDSIAAFLDRLTPHALGREEQVRRFREYLQSVLCGRTSKDTVPPEIKRWVDDERHAAGLTWKELELHSGVSVQMFQRKDSPIKRGFRRSTTARLARFFGSTRLERAATSDIFWDRIVSIEPRGVQDTFDVTVEIDHNFVADGLIVHNSHTAAYALVGFQTAYLKAHYTPEFMAALLSSEIDDSNKRDIMVEHIDDARRLGADVLPPDINGGDVEFTVRDGKVLFALGAVKGVGRGACAEIVRARQEKGPFRDLYDFCERTDPKLVGRMAVEKLVKAGAFDCLGANRNQLFTALPAALSAAAGLQQDRRRGQGNFFDLLDGDTNGSAKVASTLPDVAEWPSGEKLKYEKEALDFYFSSHPLAQYADDLQQFSTHASNQLGNLNPEQEIVIGGMMSQIRLMTTKKPSRSGMSRYARCKLEDLNGAVECVMWTDEFARYGSLFQEDKACFVRATVDRAREEPMLVFRHIWESVEAARRDLARALTLEVKLGEHSPQVLDRVAPVLQRAKGNCPVNLRVIDAADRKLDLRLSGEFRINPATLVLSELEELLGKGRARLTGPGNGRAGK